MKKKNVSKNFMLVFALVTLFIGSIAPIVSSATTNSYTEDFEDDTVDSNPSDSFYTYTENGWDYANVTNDSYHTGSKSFRINTTNGASSWSLFNFKSDDYEYMKIWFKIDNTSHNVTYIDVEKANGDSLFVMFVNTTSIYFGSDSNATWTNTLINNSWYMLRFDFNYSDSTVRGRLYNQSGGLLNDSWYDPGIVFSEINYLNLSGTSGNTAYIYFDNILLYDSDSSYSGMDSTTSNLLMNIIPILIALLLIMFAVSIALAGATKENLITLLVVTVLVVVTIQVILSL